MPLNDGAGEQTMRITLDDQPCSVEARSVGEAIAAAADLAESNGRLVVEVYVDGEKLNDQALGEEQRMASNADEVRLVSVEPTQMVRQTLLDAAELLESIDQTQRTAAERLQEADEATGFEMLGEALEMWIIVQRATLQSAQLLSLDLDAVRTDEMTMLEGIERLNGHLVQLRSALQSRDSVSVSDTLLYEMPAVVEAWEALLKRTAESVTTPTK